MPSSAMRPRGRERRHADRRGLIAPLYDRTDISLPAPRRYRRAIASSPSHEDDVAALAASAQTPRPEGVTAPVSAISPREAAMLAMQRSAGNQAVVAMLRAQAESREPSPFPAIPPGE